MRGSLIWLTLACWVALVSPVAAGTGRVIKVLPQFIDLKGRDSLSPSLYDRDAYQAILRQHPEKRSGMRFHIQWKTKAPTWEQVKLRVEMRGTTHGDTPQQLVLEELVTPGGSFSHWTDVTLTGDNYKKLGAVTAWRVTLLEGEELLGEQKSFLW